MMLPPPYLIAGTVLLGMKASLLLFQTCLLSFGKIAQSLSHLTIKLFSRSRLVCPCGQLHMSVEVEGASFGAGASFLINTISDGNTHFTVDSDSAVPDVSSSWQA